MKQALRQLAEDFLSAFLFVAVYALTGNLYAGVACAIAAGLGRIAWLSLGPRRRRPVDPMQWMSLGLVVVLGGAAILAHSPRFIMLKPSIAHLAVAAIMLRRGWLNRYLPPIVVQHVPAATIVAAGYAWAALQAALAVANVIVALECSIATWAWFASAGALVAQAAAFAAQYAVFRAIVRRRLTTPAPAYRPMIAE